MIELIHGDCLEEMKKIPDGSVDMVLTDPPYGTTQNKWDSVIDLERMWLEVQRVIKVDGAIVMTSNPPFSLVLGCSNIHRFRYHWTWVKTKITGVLNAKKMPVRKSEQILVFYIKQPTYNPQGLIEVNKITKQGGQSNNYGKRSEEPYQQKYTNYPRDVLEIPSEGKTIHPTQKPVALMEYLIKTYTNEGETVLDFTCGSGTTLVAAKNLNRNAIGIELDKDYYEIAKKRIGI